jgi:hypothetical protein
MSIAFLEYKWPALTADDKRALATFMQATKGPQRAAPLIEGDNSRAFITQGYAYQRLAWASPRSLAT